MKTKPTKKTVFDKQKEAGMCEYCIKTYCQLATPCDRPADDPCGCSCHKNPSREALEIAIKALEETKECQDDSCGVYITYGDCTCGRWKVKKALDTINKLLE